MNVRTKSYEYSLVTILILGVAAAVIGAGLVSWSDVSFLWGIVAWTVALVATAASLGLSFPIQTLHRVGRDTTGGARYERLRRWNRVKVSSILLNLLLILAGIVLATAALSRVGVVHVELDAIGAHRALAILVLGLLGTSTFAHYHALRMDLKPDRSGAMRILTFTTLQVAVAVTLLGVYIASRPGPVELLMTFRPHDAVMLHLASAIMVGVVTMIARGLPTLYVLLSDDHGAYAGRDYMSRQKSVVMPTVVAFTLMFGFLLLMIVFGAGALGAVQQVTSNKSILLLLLLIVIAAVAGLSMSLVISRQEDRVVLYRQQTPKEKREQIVLVSISAMLAIGFAVAAFSLKGGGNVFSLPQHRWLDLASISVLAAVGPLGFHASTKHRRTRDMELRFPDFLRDLASSHKGGLTLVQAVHVAARGEYGALSAEVKKMADQLSWNVGFEEAFERFGERVATSLTQRTVSLVLEAGRSGGNTTDILLAAARDAREIKTLERERRLSMSVYTTVIYVTFLVFLFVVGVLYDQFVPQILNAGQAVAESDLADVGLSLTGVDIDDYRTFYFSAGIVQAIGNGMMAGLMGSGRGVLGLRHAFIMVLLTYISFAFIMGV